MTGLKTVSFMLSIFLLLSVLTGCASVPFQQQKSEKGFLDLSHCDLAHGMPVKLSDGWELIPQSEAGVSNLKTYRLTVAPGNTPCSLGLYIPDDAGVVQAWVNATPVNPVSGTGILGFFEHRGGHIVITLKAKRTIPFEILLGSKEQILRLGLRQFGLDVFFIVVILFAGFYQFMIFCLRKKEKAYLYSAIFCIAASLYTASLPPEPLLLFFFPGMDYYAYYSISLLASLIANAFFILYLNVLYPGYIPKPMCTFIKILAGVFAGFMLLMNVFHYFKPLYLVYYLYLAIFIFLCLYLFIILFRVRKDNKEAIIIIAGFAILCVTSAAYLLYNNFVAYGLQLNKVGWLVFILLQAFILSRKSARAFTGVEEMTDRLISLNKLKDDFLTNTAHELKTPLHGIIGLGESMLENTGNQESLPLVISSARRLAELVDNILIFARMKNHDITLQRKALSISQIVEVVFAVTRPMAKEKKIILHHEISENLPSVYADESSVFRIMYNLVGNAIKFTESGEIRASAAVEKNMLAISISDSGIGMAPDKLKSLFLPFENSGAYENSSDNGTGLGLAITKRLVEMHGGSITAQSEPGVGSLFTFSLPIISLKAQNSQIGITSKKDNSFNEAIVLAKESDKSPKQSHTLLIVDDEPVNLRVIAEMLKTENYALMTANGSSEVFRLLDKKKKPDLIVLDVMMPGMSGYEVCRKLREQYSLYDLPILLVTIKNQPSDILAGFEAGANDYLTKPFQERELKARIKNQLDIKTALKKGIRAEMNFLQAQIKPHFLYNTLNVITSLIRTQPDKSCELMAALSHYLREIFGFEGSHGMVSLKRELDTVRAYLDIMTARFPDKIKTSYIGEWSGEIEVPHLILQPIVENAIKHGILPKEGPGSIIIGLSDQGNQVLITIYDDGLGMDQEKIDLLLSHKLKDAGIGVANVNKRMLTIYGHGLEVESRPGHGTKVSFKLSKQGGTLNEDYPGG